MWYSLRPPSIASPVVSLSSSRSNNDLPIPSSPPPPCDALILLLVRVGRDTLNPDVVEPFDDVICVILFGGSGSSKSLVMSVSFVSSLLGSCGPVWHENDSSSSFKNEKLKINANFSPQGSYYTAD